ncbi:MAG: hypothetical protein K2L93_07250 [Muribaculaceae bacterium]|nr:hypothetical protein [Muribaculaceae bacterium]
MLTLELLGILAIAIAGALIAAITLAGAAVVILAVSGLIKWSIKPACQPIVDDIACETLANE